MHIRGMAHHQKSQEKERGKTQGAAAKPQPKPLKSALKQRSELIKIPEPAKQSAFFCDVCHKELSTAKVGNVIHVIIYIAVIVFDTIVTEQIIDTCLSIVKHHALHLWNKL